MKYLLLYFYVYTENQQTILKKISFPLFSTVSYLFFLARKYVLFVVLLGQFFFKSQIFSFATCGVCANRPSYTVSPDSFTVSEVRAI